MGHSRKPGPTRDFAAGGLVPGRTPGSLGKNDAADPNAAGVSDNRPGPTGERTIIARNNVRLFGAAPRSQAATPTTTTTPTPPAAAAVHYLVQAGIDRVNADQARYPQRFPSDYYDTLCRHLFEVALNRNARNYGAAFWLLNELQDARLGTGLQRRYTQVVGTDSANGWDKVRHFAYTAYLEWNSLGVLAPEVFTYGKELWDQLEYWWGSDPEGYSVPDVRADNRGEAFAEEMRGRMIAEVKAEIAREVRRRWSEFTSAIVTGSIEVARAILAEIIRRAIRKFSIPPLVPRL